MPREGSNYRLCLEHVGLWRLVTVIPLLIGATCFWMAARHFNLWLHADRYVAAELEVTHFDPQLGDGDQGRLIEGIVHPAGERVYASDRDLAIRQFVSSDDDTGRRVPLPDEIEGQRMAVWYWPQHDDAARWWHPSAVVMPGATQMGGAGLRDVLLGVAFVGVGLFCFRRRRAAEAGQVH